MKHPLMPYVSGSALDFFKHVAELCQQHGGPGDFDVSLQLPDGTLWHLRFDVSLHKGEGRRPSGWSRQDGIEPPT